MVTSGGFLKRGVVDDIRSQCETIDCIIDSIQPNPTFNHLRTIYKTIAHADYDVILALGGGSVIDASKVLSVYGDGVSFSDIEQTIRKQTRLRDFVSLPIIAVPTTAGTGSEVTPWATVWDMNEKKKYSLHLENRFCESCICDPSLTVTMPRELTLQTALDALSHALEAIWNKNGNPLSSWIAVRAARDIMDSLYPVLDDLENLYLREQILRASLFAGYAFSNTKTTIAHAISYYVTAHKDVPHGIACSFTLPDILDCTIGLDRQVDEALEAIFSELSSKKLRNLFEKVGLSTKPSDYGLDNNDLLNIRASLTSSMRSQNSLVCADSIMDRLHTRV